MEEIEEMKPSDQVTGSIGEMALEVDDDEFEDL